MGWRFRKTFGRGPFRWTLTKKGIGCSWGIPGLRYGISPSGQKYISAGIPGTGLYYIKYFPLKPLPFLPSSQNQPTLPKPPPTPLIQNQNPPTTKQPPWWKQKGL
jgi:hypothetical protein